ncbi:MAG TPA: Lrp/AsnC family transcriptional regulator [Mesorhizobium sp.]|jgi:DNA-binding Lrp family transcriptional regulator|nr:Lrp/AsnC family transcriptional regulator [Mesorhizobium sp.]
MDEKDRILLGALTANARESLVSLARRVGLSRSATQERLKRLERNGTISGYSVRLAPEAPQEGTLALIAVTYAPGTKCDDIVPRLRLMPEIRSCISLAGATDLMLRVSCTSTAALEEVRNRLEHTRGVASTRTHIMLITHW